jgi:hypothetical protein
VATDKQRGYAYNLLKEGGFPTSNMRALQRADDDVPHVYDLNDDERTSVWDWLGELDVKWASEVIEYLKEHQ